MLTVDSFTNPRYCSCTHIVSRPGSRNALVVDPGDPSMEAPIRFLESRNMTAGTVVLTHEHYDHIAGVDVLRNKYGSRLICSEICAQSIGDPRRNFSRYLTGSDYSCPREDATCEELNWNVGWAGRKIRFFSTPGHSPGSICIALGSLLFTGDTLVRDMRAVTKLPGGDKRALELSIVTLLREFDGETIVYPGHGESLRLREATLATVLGKQVE